MKIHDNYWEARESLSINKNKDKNMPRNIIKCSWQVPRAWSAAVSLRTQIDHVTSNEDNNQHITKM